MKKEKRLNIKYSKVERRQNWFHINYFRNQDKNMKNKKIKRLCYVLTPLIFLIFSIYSGIKQIPETIFVRQGEGLNYNHLLKISSLSQNSKAVTVNSGKVDLSLLGVVPIKTVKLETVPKLKICPSGRPVGIKLKTEGVLVVGLSDIETLNGKKNSPASVAGIEIGDSIIKINGENIQNSKDVTEKVNKNKEQIMKIIVIRNGKNIEKQVTPVKCNLDENYKLGVWIRDSTAGVGTLTFYDENSGKFAALGHPITDVDTGTILKVDKGNIIRSSIISVKKGLKGNPGEVRGIFVDEEKSMGNIENNTECGIYGTHFKNYEKSKMKPMEIALRNEIKEGNAQILTTVDGEEPKLYSITIEKLLVQDVPGPKSMVIRVTDEELLKKTGGIVQGMSGSPIIQNNKVVGAVTHVLINKPDVGYGIYIEWMLKEAGMLQNK